MSPQTSYSYDQPIGLPGMLSDSSLKKSESFFNEDATEIPFGVMVKQGTAINQCKKLTTITDRIVGFSLHTHATTPGPLGGIINKGPVDVLTQGVVIVRVEDAVTPASVPHVRAVAVAPEVAGAVRGSVDATDCIPLYGARFLSSAGPGELARLEFDLNAHMAGVAAAGAAALP